MWSMPLEVLAFLGHIFLGQIRIVQSLPSNRYVLCPDAKPSAFFGDAKVRGFAASVASSEVWMGRMMKAPYLRVALLIDRDWELSLPGEGVKNKDFAKLGHSTRMSYQKCMNPGLHVNTEVSCRLAHQRDGRLTANGTWLTGRLMRYRNLEVSIDFAECDLTDGPMRWIHRRDGPSKVTVELRLKHHTRCLECEKGTKTLATAIMPVDLCMVRRPMMNMAFCTLPLYGLSALQTELPWIVEDWLQYHLEYLGIQHAQIYDIDGSFEQALENWTRWSDHRRGFVTYQKEWPKTLSDALTRMSRDHPCCTEIFAYAHCTTTQRALSRWVLLLHSPDEYVVFSKNRKTLKALPSFIEEFVERGGWDGRLLGMLAIQAVSFARGGPGSDETAMQRGAILQASMQRSNQFYHHSGIVNPEYCACMGPHICHLPLRI